MTENYPWITDQRVILAVEKEVVARALIMREQGERVLDHVREYGSFIVGDHDYTVTPVEFSFTPLPDSPIENGIYIRGHCNTSRHLLMWDEESLHIRRWQRDPLTRPSFNAMFKYGDCRDVNHILTLRRTGIPEKRMDELGLSEKQRELTRVRWFLDNGVLPPLRTWIPKLMSIIAEEVEEAQSK